METRNHPWLRAAAGLLALFGASWGHASNPPAPQVEFPVTDAVTSISKAWQDASDTAVVGDRFLVVWEDDRECAKSIYAARVDWDKTVVDPAGFRLSPKDATSARPRVAAGAGLFCAVWTREDPDSLTVRIEAARVAPDATVLDADPIRISPDFAGLTAFSAVAFDGENFVIVWSMPGTQRQDVFGARLTPQGELVAPGVFTVCDGPENQVRADIACGGDVCLAAFRDARADPAGPDIYASLIDRNNGVLDPQGFELSGAGNIQTNPAVAFLTDQFLVVWEDARDDTQGLNTSIYGTRVSSSGTVKDPPGIAVAVQNTSNQANPTLSPLGQAFHVVWADDRRGDFDLFAATVNADGTVPVPGGSAILSGPGYHGSPAMETSAGGVAIFFTQGNAAETDQDISLLRLDGTGAPIEPDGQVVSLSAQTQWFPAVAFNGTLFFAVWEDYRDPAQSDLFGARIQTDGTVLDPQGIRLSDDSRADIEPAVASDGQDFLVVWERAWAIRGTRVSGGGAVLDPQGFDIHVSPGGLNPSVVWGEGNYLVAWEDPRGDGDLWGQRVDSLANILDPGGIELVGDPGLQTGPALAYGQGMYLLVFSDDRAEPLYPDIYMIRLDSQARPVSVQASPLCEDPFNVKAHPAVAAGTGGFLVAWEDSRNGFADEADIYAARVTGSGQVLEPGGMPLSALDGTNRLPCLAAFQDDYLAVWLGSGSTSVMAARVRGDGFVLDKDGLDLSVAARCRAALALAPGTSGTALALPEGFWPGPYNSDSVQGTLIQPIDFAVQLSRWDSRAALAGAPDRVFSGIRLPWQDPEPVLTPGPAWDTLYYRLDLQDGNIYLVKSASTVSVGN